jgi:hypothetical protein
MSETPATVSRANSNSQEYSIFSDESIHITLAPQACQLTDVEITPIKQTTFTQLDGQTCGYLFTCATVLSSVLFDAVKCDATMILLFDTPQQTSVRILSRSENDGLFTQLNRKEANLDELTTLSRDIASNIIVYEKSKESSEKKTQSANAPIDVKSASSAKSEQVEGGDQKTHSPKKSLYDYHFRRIA